jgi:hypothetical protein
MEYVLYHCIEYYGSWHSTYLRKHILGIHRCIFYPIVVLFFVFVFNPVSTFKMTVGQETNISQTWIAFIPTTFHQLDLFLIRTLCKLAYTYTHTHTHFFGSLLTATWQAESSCIPQGTCYIIQSQVFNSGESSSVGRTEIEKWDEAIK